MADMKQHKLGWIGIGRMGYAMAERLAKAGCDISVWNRTKAKAEPLAKSGAKVVDNLTDLASCDILFTMGSTGKDVKEVLYGANGVMSKGGKPKMVVDSTSISLEESAEIRAKLAEMGVKFLAAPVSGNAKVIKANKLTVVASGPKDAYDTVAPYLLAIGRGSSYVGEGELSRIVAFDPDFAWLHPLTGLILDIDDRLARPRVSEQDIHEVRAEVERLFGPDASLALARA